MQSFVVLRGWLVINNVSDFVLCRQEIANEHSLIFLENFTDHWTKLKELEEGIIQQELEREERLARKRGLEGSTEVQSVPKKIKSDDHADNSAPTSVNDLEPTTTTTTTTTSTADGTSTSTCSTSSADAAPVPELDLQGKERVACVEERDGIIGATCIWNDRKHESLIKLTRLKEIISLQLPNMSKDYITRLVFDRYVPQARVHRSYC
jgi:hypothetical protein